MALRRPVSTVKTRDWPSTMAHLAYMAAGLALVLVFVQFWLYSIHYNRVFTDDAVTAVTLTNGQTYFGQLEKFGPHTAVLFHVYYLQVNPTTDAAATDTADATNTDQSNIKLMKLEDDFHQPNDYLVLNRDQVLYWQHLQADSPILEAIQDYESSQTE